MFSAGSVGRGWRFRIAPGEIDPQRHAPAIEEPLGCLACFQPAYAEPLATSEFHVPNIDAERFGDPSRLAQAGGVDTPAPQKEAPKHVTEHRRGQHGARGTGEKQQNAAWNRDAAAMLRNRSQCGSERIMRRW